MSGPATVVQSDEAMAIAMQERYRQEFLQRQSHKNRSSRHRSGSNGMSPTSGGRVAPVDLDEEERKRQEEDDAALARRLAMEEEARESHPASRVSDGLTEDERLARQLHEAEMMQRYGGVSEQAPASGPTRVHSHSPFVASLYGSGMGVNSDPETAAAVRVAQELEDEDMARRYGQYERDAAARRQAVLVQAAEERKRRRRKCLILPLICVVIAIVIVALFATGVLNKNKIPGLQNIDWIDHDPFGGDSNFQAPEAAYAWENKGKGLTLQLLNALDDSYQSVYNTAIQNWDNGDPDALTLTSEQIGYEKECSSVNGRLKVCNGDYGATRWRGINEVLHNQRIIYSSTARLNDYYLQDGSEGQKLYTSCHEIGHGFGLPHWDEDFYNKDLGNCMDYTDEPEKNATPDKSNYEFLAKVYGTVTPNRRLRGLPKATSTQDALAPFPQWLVTEYQIAREEMEAMLVDNNGSNRGGWRRLESLTSRGRLESHERDLGGGYTLQSFVLSSHKHVRPAKSNGGNFTRLRGSDTNATPEPTGIRIDYHNYCPKP